MKTKSRGNGQGTAYKRGRTWEAQVIVGWKKSNTNPTGPLIPIKRRKGGFASKKDAIQYLDTLRTSAARKRRTLQQVYDAWSDFYEPRIGSSTMTNYSAAYKHFSPLHSKYIDEISSDDLQRCMDDCPAGHRTPQNMKCVARPLWGDAYDQNIVDRDVTSNLFIGRGASVQRDPITRAEVAAIRDAIPTYRYADYIYCLCYLGFRPGEMLELKKDMLHCAVLPADDDHPEERTVYYFINGKKTPAGKDRIVIVPDQILELVLSRLFIPGTDLVFPMYVFSRKEGQPFRHFKPMTHEYFNKHVFKPLMAAHGFPSKKVPSCARHTYADMLKNASGSDKDKAALIGHSTYLFTQQRYQSSAVADLKALVDSFE